MDCNMHLIYYNVFKSGEVYISPDKPLYIQRYTAHECNKFKGVVSTICVAFDFTSNYQSVIITAKVASSNSDGWDTYWIHLI